MTLFHHGKYAVVRLSALPHSRSDLTKAPLDPGQPSHRDQLRSLVSALWQDLIIQEAVAVSSESLAHTIRGVEAGRAISTAKLERAAFALSRYVLRMTGRPTPFGLLAGVQLAEFTRTASVRLGSHHRKFSQPDAAWLSSISASLLTDPAVRDAAMVTINNLCQRRGDRLIVPYVRERVQGSAASNPYEVSIALTPVVATVHAAAVRPLEFAALRRQVMAAFTTAEEATVDRLLVALIDQEVLLTNLQTQGPDRLENLIQQLEPGHPLRAKLQSIASMLADYDCQPLGHGQAAWKSATDAMQALRVNHSPPVQVDLQMDANIAFPVSVAREAARVAELLWRLGPATPGPPPLRDYVDAFRERYGDTGLVPVLDLLDPQRGLGPPATFEVPRGQRSVRLDGEHYPAQRDEILAQRCIEVLTGDTNELALDDNLVNALSQPTELPPPPSIELCAHLFADSAAAIDTGDFQMELTVLGSTRAAGATVGRFAQLLDIESLMPTILGADAVADNDAILPAQLYFQTRTPRLSNVSQAGALIPHSIAAGVFADIGDPQVVDVRDIVVGIAEYRLRAIWARTGQELFVITPHALNLTTAAPNVARFLTAIRASATRPWSPWDWGRCNVLPHLPAVRSGRTVLAPAQWRTDSALADHTLSWSAWATLLERWRERWHVPDRVQVNLQDHRVELDLNAQSHRQLLRSHLHKHSQDRLYAPPGGQTPGLGWCTDHANEVVIPLTTARTTRAPSRVTVRSVTTTPTAYPPGGEWLFAKLYAQRENHDSLLCREIPRLCLDLPTGVDRWFFIRYNDPYEHLRLRWHGTPSALTECLLPRLHEWAVRAQQQGLVAKLVLDTYEPETARYGGLAMMAVVERLFAADSEAVIGQLQSRPAISGELLAAMNYVELLGGLGEWDWMSWVLEQFRIDVQKNATAAERQLALELVDPSRGWNKVRDSAGGSSLIETWHAREAAVHDFGCALELGPGRPPSVQRSTAIVSVLHMHANRLLGTDREAELRSYGLLRTAVRSMVGKLRNNP